MLASQNIVIILCGNKKDLDADREVTFLEASRFAQENGTNGNRTFSCFFLGVVLSKSVTLEASRPLVFTWMYYTFISTLTFHLGTKIVLSNVVLS